MKGMATDMGPICYFLRIQVDKKEGQIFLHKEKNVDGLFKNLGAINWICRQLLKQLYDGA